MTKATIKKKPGRGRPESISRAKIEAICATITMGATIEAAAASAGINQCTIYDWLEKGRAEQENPTGRNPLFSEFSEKYARALGKAEELLVKMVRDAAPDDWRAAAWMLERRFPHKYGRQQVDVDFNGKLVVEDNHAAMRGLLDDDEAISAAELIARKMTTKNG